MIHTKQRSAPDGTPCFRGTIDYYGRLPYLWEIRFVGNLPPVDERDGLMNLLPSWKDFPRGDVQ